MQEKGSHTPRASELIQLNFMISFSPLLFRMFTDHVIKLCAVTITSASDMKRFVAINTVDS